MRSSPLKRSYVSSHGDGSSPKRLLAGSCSASVGDGEGSIVVAPVSSFAELDGLLNKAFQMCSQLPTTSTRLSYSAGFLAPGHAFDEVAAKDELSMEVASIEMLRNNINHCRGSLSILKKQQDIRCKPFEDEAASLLHEMKDKEATAAAAAAAADAADVAAAAAAASSSGPG